MADVKWIKITTDIFDDEKILLIESLPDSYAIITIWFKLLCLAGKQNNSGVFMMGRVAYTDKMLATIFRMKESTVTMALQVFEQFGMIEIVDGVITIPNWGKHQNLDQLESKKEYMRNYMKDYRAKQKALTSGDSPCKTSSKTNSKANVSQAEEDIDIDIDIEIDKENRETKRKIDLQSIADLYNSICISFPSIRSLSASRQKAIKARLNTYTVDDFKKVFEMAESSSFLKGANERNWTADFDWLIRDSNMAKVLEGKYADKPKKFGGGRKESIPSWYKIGERELDEEEKESIRRMMNDDLPFGGGTTENTIANDPELAARAEKLKEQLKG